VQDGVNIGAPIRLVSQPTNIIKLLIYLDKNTVVGMLIKTSRCGIMVQMEKLRDWNPADGSPK
jgi:hypothetical protein